MAAAPCPSAAAPEQALQKKERYAHNSNHHAIIYNTQTKAIINPRITIQRVLPNGRRTVERVRPNRGSSAGHRRGSLRNTVTNFITENRQQIDLSNAAEQLAAELGTCDG